MIFISSNWSSLCILIGSNLIGSKFVHFELCNLIRRNKFVYFGQRTPAKKNIIMVGSFPICKMLGCKNMWIFKNIPTQSVASPRTQHLSMITIVTFTFELWPPKSIGFTMINMSAKFDEEAHNGLVSIRFTDYFHICPLWPWPLTSKINRVHPLTKVNISAKFDEEIHNGSVSIVFTSLSPYMSIVTLTFDLQNQ